MRLSPHFTFVCGRVNCLMANAFQRRLRRRLPVIACSAGRPSTGDAAAQFEFCEILPRGRCPDYRTKKARHTWALRAHARAWFPQGKGGEFRSRYLEAMAAQAFAQNNYEWALMHARASWPQLASWPRKSLDLGYLVAFQSWPTGSPSWPRLASKSANIYARSTAVGDFKGDPSLAGTCRAESQPISPQGLGARYRHRQRFSPSWQGRQARRPTTPRYCMCVSRRSAIHFCLAFRH